MQILLHTLWMELHQGMEPGLSHLKLLTHLLPFLAASQKGGLRSTICLFPGRVQVLEYSISMLASTIWVPACQIVSGYELLSKSGDRFLATAKKQPD